ncbi:MAG: hypothetical protein CL799_09340 [Chromatiales bacterium]|jgi:hypothetical protein|nr:hypothetical protein [Chromatiales bacterium]|tara:strand:+ start:283 stop:609 length:327 start_codon:yes stop_codon:yes gene_type:complete
MMSRRKELTDAPDKLSDKERERISEWVLVTWESTGHRLVPQLGRLWESCRDWHLSNGVQRASWEATFRRWIRKEEEFSRTTQKLRNEGGQGKLLALLHHATGKKGNKQ